MWAKGRECSQVLVGMVGQSRGGEVQGEGGEAVHCLTWAGEGTDITSDSSQQHASSAGSPVSVLHTITEPLAPPANTSEPQGESMLAQRSLWELASRWYSQLTLSLEVKVEYMYLKDLFRQKPTGVHMYQRPGRRLGHSHPQVHHGQLP